MLQYNTIRLNDADIQAFLDAVPNPHNGLTFCAGSLSAGAHNDVPALAKKQLRNLATQKLNNV